MRHVGDKARFIVIGIVIGASVCGFWYIFQKLYLKYFCLSLDAKKREKQAVTKENQVRNVLNLQQDAVIIFSAQDDHHGANESEGSNQSSYD